MILLHLLRQGILKCCIRFCMHHLSQLAWNDRYLGCWNENIQTLLQNLFKNIECKINGKKERQYSSLLVRKCSYFFKEINVSFFHWIFTNFFLNNVIKTHPLEAFELWKFLILSKLHSGYSSNQCPGAHPAINVSSSSPCTAKFCPAAQNFWVLRHASSANLHCTVLYFANSANSSSHVFENKQVYW